LIATAGRRGFDSYSWEEGGLIATAGRRGFDSYSCACFNK
jgi:hypothetical protein